MPESIAAEISIGGEVPRLLIPALASAISDQGVSDEWGGSCLSEDQVIEIINDVNANNVATFYDDQARYGQFDELEEFCMKNKVDFDRHSDAKYEYSAEISKCRKGKVIGIGSDQDGNELIYAEDIDKILNRYYKKKISAVTALDKIKVLINKVPPLHILVILENV
jgi:hypothetical protein